LIIFLVLCLYSQDSTNEQNVLCENTYGRVVGALRTLKGQKYLIIFKSSPVTDMNEVTCHILEVIQTRMKLKKLKEGDVSQSSFTDYHIDNYVV